MGDAAAAMARTNISNTISCMKLLVGRRFDDPEVQRELSKQTFKAAKLPGGGVGICIMYNDEEIVVSAEHVFAMMLVEAKNVARSANGGVSMADSVLAVPNWFTDSQRKGILAACEIGSVNCLRICNESSAIALSYGIFKSAKKLFSESEPQHIMFIDMGYTCYTVTIVDFIQENMKVLSTVCDPNLGGRQFDDVIIEFLAESFQAKTGINVRNNKKAVLKLAAAAEKAKKTLSPAGVNEANISVECLAEDRDLNVMLTREEFEKRSADLVARLEGPILQALAEAKLEKHQLYETEIVGGSTRINIVKKRLGEILGLDPTAMNYGLKTTMNSDEAVARGGALLCAMNSSRMKVKPFTVVDVMYYGVVAHYEPSAPSASEDGESKDEGKGFTKIYSRGFSIPHKARRLNFRKKSADFTITLTYDEEATAMLPPGETNVIATYTIKVSPECVANGPLDVRVDFNLDKHGCVYIQDAQMLEELPAEDPVAPPAGEGKEGEEKSAAAVPAVPPKKKFRKIDLVVVSDVFGLTKDDVKAAIELEANMANEDRLIIETADKRNELESYIYSMRDKIDGVLAPYSTPSEKDSLKKLLNDAEEWLYGDGYESTKSIYASKINELKVVGNAIENRYNEENTRQNAVDQFKVQIEHVKSFVQLTDEAHNHITDDERNKLRTEAASAEEWLYDMLYKQGELPKSSDPILTCDAITKKRNALFALSNPIMTKPKPKPAPTPAPAPAEEKKDVGEEKKEGGDEKKGGAEGGEAPMEEANDGHAQEQNVPSSEPMET